MAMGHPGSFAVMHPMGMHAGRVVFNNRHRFFRNRFVVVGGGIPYGYGYYDDCYARVWTAWGWRWQYICY